MTYSASFWMHLCVAVALKAALVLMLLRSPSPVEGTPFDAWRLASGT
jgi:hypothetical protein